MRFISENTSSLLLISWLLKTTFKRLWEICRQPLIFELCETCSGPSFFGIGFHIYLNKTGVLCHLLGSYLILSVCLLGQCKITFNSNGKNRMPLLSRNVLGIQGPNPTSTKHFDKLVVVDLNQAPETYQLPIFLTDIAQSKRWTFLVCLWSLWQCCNF